MFIFITVVTRMDFDTYIYSLLYCLFVFSPCDISCHEYKYVQCYDVKINSINPFFFLFGRCYKPADNTGNFFFYYCCRYAFFLLGIRQQHTYSFLCCVDCTSSLFLCGDLKS